MAPWQWHVCIFNCHFHLNLFHPRASLSRFVFDEHCVFEVFSARWCRGLLSWPQPWDMPSSNMHYFDWYRHIMILNIHLSALAGRSKKTFSQRCWTQGCLRTACELNGAIYQYRNSAYLLYISFCARMMGQSSPGTACMPSAPGIVSGGSKKAMGLGRASCLQYGDIYIYR